MRLGEDLKAITDTQNGAATLRELFERTHYFREAGDGARPEVVAVGEAARHHDGIHALQARVRVPQLHGLSAGKFYRVQRIAVAVGAREDGDPDPHESTSHSYSSTVGFASSRRHIPSTSSADSSSISMRRPMWTLSTPRSPGPVKRGGRPLLAGRGCRSSAEREREPSIHCAPFFDLGNPPEHLGVGLFDTAHVTPEAILVQPLTGLLIPEAAGVRADLVGQHQVSVLVAPHLYLEINEGYAAFVKEGGQNLVDLQR